MSNDPAGDDRAAVRVPPPLVALLTMVAGYGLERVVPLATATAIPPLVRYGVGGFIVAGSVAALSVWPIILFRRSGQDPRPWTPTPELLVEGAYSYTRNPMYLMMLLVCAGAALDLAHRSPNPGRRPPGVRRTNRPELARRSWCGASAPGTRVRSRSSTSTSRGSAESSRM